MPWFALSHLCLPPHFLTLPPDLSASAWIPSSPPLTSRRLGLLHPISACYLVCSPFPQTCQPVLGSHQVLHSPQDGLVSFILFLPATLFAHPFPRPVSPCLDPIKSSTHLKPASFASSSFCLLPCLLTLSPDLSARAWIPSSPPLTSR